MKDPLQASSARHYDQWHKGMAEMERHGHSPLQPWHRTVLRLLPDLNGKRVLEIGSGRGDFSIALGKLFPLAAVTGVDLSVDAVRVAHSKLSASAGEATFAAGDAQRLPFASASFDYIVSCECLEHVPSPELMTAEIARLLKPGGRFALTTENYLNGMSLAWLQSRMTGRPFNSGAGVQPIEHYFLFWKVRRMLRKSGLAVDHLESNHFQWLLLPKVNPAALCTEDFDNPFLKRLFRPFGRHFTFLGKKR